MRCTFKQVGLTQFLCSGAAIAMSRFGEIAPDPNAPDFLLLRDRVVQSLIMTIQKLKQVIVDEVSAIDEGLQ